jgi:hypothetical protein
LYVAPKGTVTVKLFVVAAVTVALVAPKNTIFKLLDQPNPAPVIVTLLPTGSDDGLKEVIVGAVANKFTTTKIEIAKRKILCFIQMSYYMSN